MPTYSFLNKETGERFDDFLSISKKEELLEKNPHIQQIPTGFAITTMTGELKTDDGFKEVMSKISDKHPDSPLAEKYGQNKTIKQTKIKTAVEKWKKPPMKWSNL